MLHQNSIGTGFQPGPAHIAYLLQRVVNSNLTFALNVRAKVLQQETSVDTNNHFGFVCAIYSGGYLIQFGLGPTELAATLGNNLATFDTSGVYHDIRVQGNFGTNANFELYVDHNILIGGTSTIATPLSDGSLPPDSLYFGDLTGGANAKADLSSYSFVQPVPITPVIHPAVEITWNSLLNVQLSTSGG